MIAAAGAVAPAAATAAGVTVRIAGGERHFAPGEVDAAVDQPAGSYLLRAPGTSAEPVAHPPAVSMRRLAMLAGVAPDAVSFVTIERPNGTLALLRRADLADPPPFADGPPIVWMDAGGTRYLRPLGSPDDVNATDNIGVTEGDLAVRIHTGRLLEVTAAANRRRVAARTPVSFSAEVDRGGAGLTYEWTLGDGTRKTGRSIRHRFRTRGVYEAVVTVHGADDSGGSSEPLRIRVGDPPPDSGRTGRRTGGGTGHPDRTPAQGPAEGPASGTGGAPAADDGAPARDDSRAGRAAEPGTAAGTPAEVGGGEAAGGEDGAEAVSGTLVAARDAVVMPAPVGSPQAEARAGAQAAARRGTDSEGASLGTVVGILAAVALFGLGGRLEWRQLR